MAKITYTLYPFDSKQAELGHLCVMAKNVAFTDANISTIDNASINSNMLTPNSNFKGAGICTVANGIFKFTADSQIYSFNSSGTPYDAITQGWKLYLAEVGVAQISQPVGSVVKATQEVKVIRNYEGVAPGYEDGEASTRGNRSGDAGEEVDNNTIVGAVKNTTIIEDVSDPETGGKDIYIDSLTPRDHFAMQALRGLMAGMPKGPAGMSPSVINQYCDEAYQWAANMMLAAANVRATFEDKTAKDTSNVVAIGELESNTEKLLNNIMAGLIWKESINPTTPGGAVTYEEHTVVKELNSFMRQFKNIQETVGTGSNTKYYERILVKGLEDWLNAYVAHSATEEDPREKVGLYDVVAAVESINNRLNSISTTLNTLNTTLTDGLANIVAAINGQTPEEPVIDSNPEGEITE